MKKITVGMTRTEAEAHLPPDAKIGMSFGSSGNHRDFYSVGEHWRVALVYDAPLETNLYFISTSTNGQRITNGPSSGFIYRATPTQPVNAGPFISYVKSSGQKFSDPLGGFTAEIPKSDPCSDSQEQPADNGDFRPATGDCLDILISDSKGGHIFKQSVDSDGNITVPLAGKIHVVGRTLPEVETLIQNAYLPRETELSVVVRRCPSTPKR